MQRRQPMSFGEVIVEGTLKPDGTLELDSKPNLTPGRVTVVLRPGSEEIPTKQDWFQTLQSIRARREAEGYRFMNEMEASDHIEWLREADRINELLCTVAEQNQ